MIVAFFGFFMDWNYFRSFKVRDFFAGEFQKDFNYYFKDRLPVYSRLTFLKSNFDILTGQNVSNGVLVNGKELIKIPEIPNLDKVHLFGLHTTRFLKHFNKPTYCLFIPSKLGLSDNPLKFHNENSLNHDFEFYYRRGGEDLNVNFLDCSVLFENSKEINVYYRTSNKINPYGAYLLYSSNIKKLGQSPIDMEDFNIYHVVGNYFGELYSKNFLKGVNPDTIDIFRYCKKDISFDVEEIYNDGHVLKRDTIYDFSRIDDYDKTNIIFGGKAVIKNVETDLEGKEKILIFSDENIDNFMQFLPFHYKEITIVNLRQIFYSFDNGGVLEKIRRLNVSDYDKLLFIYGVESLNDDEQFRNLKYFIR